jgi:hypothetical protein
VSGSTDRHFRLRDMAGDLSRALDFLAEIVHVADYGACGDTCSKCAAIHCYQLALFFDEGGCASVEDFNKATPLKYFCDVCRKRLEGGA